jgi:hypothetical protein
VCQYARIQNPFGVEIENVNHLPVQAHEQFVELSSDNTHKVFFSYKSLNSFWLDIQTKYPILSALAMNVLLPFVSTYLCETAFSTLTFIKTQIKYKRHRSGIETCRF